MNFNLEKPKKNLYPGKGETLANFPLADLNLHNQLEERFELLSAYLDDEVTASERQQVQQWIDNDPQLRQSYHKLLKLRQRIEISPYPKGEKSAEAISEQVFQSIDRHRYKRIAFLGGGAIAALFVATLSWFVPRGYSPIPQIAQFPEVEIGIPQMEIETLMIAINQPAVEIPKAAVASPDGFINSTEK